MIEENDKLKHISAKETSQDFTTKVMQDIYALENEKKLSKLISLNTQSETSKGFTQSVMSSIERVNIKKKPIDIFSLKQKIMIVISSLSIIIFSLFSKPKTSSNIDYSILDISKYLDKSLINVSYIFSISILCFSILLIIDYHFTNFKEAH